MAIFLTNIYHYRNWWWPVILVLWNLNVEHVMGQPRVARATSERSHASIRVCEANRSKYLLKTIFLTIEQPNLPIYLSST